MQKEETSSPTAYLESIMLTSVIDTTEDRYVANIDIPNLFIHIPIDRKHGENKITLKIKGLLVDMLVHMNPENMVPM